MLCGSSFCGCAITSVPADFAELGGAFPTIDVAGNGTGATPWNLTLNDEWAGGVVTSLQATTASLEATTNSLNAVTGKVNGIRSGTSTGTTTAGGQFVISYGATFASLPVVIVTAMTTFGRTAVLNNRTTTTATVDYRAISDGATIGLTGITVHWVAVGTLA